MCNFPGVSIFARFRWDPELPPPLEAIHAMQVSGFGFRASGFESRVSGFDFRVSVFGFRSSGFGFRVSLVLDGEGFRLRVL